MDCIKHAIDDKDNAQNYQYRGTCSKGSASQGHVIVTSFHLQESGRNIVAAVHAEPLTAAKAAQAPIVAMARPPLKPPNIL